MVFTSYQEGIFRKELSNLRLLNVGASVIVTLLSFVFEAAFHDGYILMSGIAVSVIFISNYFFSFYSPLYRKHFLNISYLSVFLLHFWAVYVAYMRQFDIAFLLPVSLSIFVFSLVFDRFYKSFVFIFVVTSVMLLLMWVSNHWQIDYTVAVTTLYSGAFVANLILQRKNEYRHEISKREKQYLTLVENMNDGLIYLDDRQRISFVNERFSAISGYDDTELLEKEFTFFLASENDRATIQRFESELKSGKASRCACAIAKKNGESAWVQLAGTPIAEEAGRQSGSMIVFTDITPLRSTQEELKKREEGYRTFIDQSAVGIWRAEYSRPVAVNLPLEQQLDLLLNSGRISECNDFMAQMYGYNHSSELIGRRIKDFYLVENNFDSEKTEQLLTLFIRNNYRISNAESKEVDRRGQTRYILNNNIGIVEDGFLVRTWGVQTDITERKKTERQLIETNQELDTFFYKASHDLKGPLASILGIVNLARIENKDQTIEDYFSMIETSVKRLDRTLMDLIELARTRQGASKLSRINVRSLVDEILQSFSHLEGFERIRFDVEADPSLFIHTDKVLLLSVMQNLIHNAINYSKKENPRIGVRACSTEAGISVEVHDNGKGIPERIKSRVFEMFYRGNPESPGSGLGLFIVKHAIEKMKGKIRFESEEGKGTSFFIEIPNALAED